MFPALYQRLIKRNKNGQTGRLWRWQDVVRSPGLLPRAENPCPIFRAIFSTLTFAGKTQRTPDYWVLDKWSLLYLLLSVFGVRGLTQTFYSIKKNSPRYALRVLCRNSFLPLVVIYSLFNESIISSAFNDKQLPYYMTPLKLNYPNQLLKKYA